MSTGMCARVLVLVRMGVAAVAVGCSSTGTGTTSGSSGSSETTPKDAAIGECFGDAKPVTELTNIDLCIDQGGDWAVGLYECNQGLGPNDCSQWTLTAKARGLDVGKRGCINRIGCRWRNPDGTLEQDPSEGGTCSGTAVRCDEIKTKSDCQLQFLPQCQWNIDDFCELRTSNNADVYPCANFTPTPTDFPATARLNRASCLKNVGCTFTRIDGTVETAANRSP